MDLTTILFCRCGTVADLGYLGDRSNELASFPHGPFTYPVPGGVLFCSNDHGIEWAIEAASKIRSTPTGPVLVPVLVPTDLDGVRVYA